MMINEDDLRKLIRAKLLTEKAIRATGEISGPDIFGDMVRWANDYLNTGTVSVGGKPATVSILNPGDVDMAEVYEKQIENIKPVGIEKDTVMLMAALATAAQSPSRNAGKIQQGFDTSFEKLGNRYLAMQNANTDTDLGGLLPTMQSIFGALNLPIDKETVDNIINFYESQGKMTEQDRLAGKLPHAVTSFLNDVRRSTTTVLKDSLAGTYIGKAGVVADIIKLKDEGLLDDNRLIKFQNFIDIIRT
jgi:hypothetical protein